MVTEFVTVENIHSSETRLGVCFILVFKSYTADDVTKRGTCNLNWDS